MTSNTLRTARWRRTVGLTGVCLALILVTTACASGGTAPAASQSATPVTSASATPGSFDLAAADAYCTDKGGTVQSRQPSYGTNGDPASWVKLGAPVNLCRFQAKDDTKSRIFVDLVSLYSQQPTLAALAYLSKTPLEQSKGGANPAAVLCAKLGGASDYGTGSNGGLVDTTDHEDTTIAPCVFADQSFIDEWGIAYFSSSTIRGKDLSTVFRFDQTALPDAFKAAA
ncbi:MAG: hypothetical protein ABI255_12490 [Microbacteriaceae bacterium]